MQELRASRKPEGVNEPVYVAGRRIGQLLGSRVCDEELTVDARDIPSPRALEEDLCNQDLVWVS
jgi:hypothetical protein